MKSLLAIVLMAISTVSWAGGPHGHRHHHAHRHAHNHWNWVAPAIVGGAVIYGLSRPAAPPQVYYMQQPSVLPPPPYGYTYVQLLDANCNCYRWVLIPG